MKPFSVLFEHSDEITYQGKIIKKNYKLDATGEYDLTFSFIEKNSRFNQAIVLLFLDFTGDFYIFDQKYKLPNSRFPKVNFWFEESNTEISVKINLVKGTVLICNGSDPLGNKQICHSLCFGCALQVEEHDDKLIFYCNDHENDDDFDDLVFELRDNKGTILKGHKTGDGSLS